MDNYKLWNLIEESWDLMKRRYETAVLQSSQRIGLDLRTWRLLLAVYESEPEGITPADLMVRNPYTSAELYIARLSGAAEKGYLDEISPNCYRMTAAGERETLRLVEIARTVMQKVDPLQRDDSRRLGSYLHRLVLNSLNSEPPPEAWAIQMSYKLMPPETPPLPFIEQNMTCLAAYREDSHLAAWMVSGLTATAFEMLTLVWRNEVRLLAEVVERLAYRGHPRVIYERSFEELWGRGYVYGDEDQIDLTEEGRLFRNQVEFDTDRYFHEPWGFLSDSEKFELGGLLVRLRDGLKIKEE